MDMVFERIGLRSCFGFYVGGFTDLEVHLGFGSIGVTL